MSSYLPDEVNELAFASAPRRSKPLGGFSENLSKAFDAGLMQSGSSEERYIKDSWDPIVQEIEDITGTSFRNPGSYIRPNVFEIVTGEAMRGYGAARYSYETNEIERFVRENRDSLPPALTTFVLDQDRDNSLREGAREKFHMEQAELAELTSRSPGIGPGFGRLLGGLAAGAEDPLNQAFMVAPVARFGKSFVGLIAGEAFTNATVEAIQQPDVADWYESLGLEYTWDEFVANVGGAAIIGGAFPIGIKIAGKTVGITVEQARRGAAVLSKATGRKTDIQKAAEIMDNAAQAIQDSNPLGTTAKEQVEHQSRLNEATVALNDGEIPKISNSPKSPVKIADNINEANNLRNLVDEFNPKDIEVDAKTFQFKEGGDIYGVTDRLEGVTQWDPIKAGMVTIYEYSDGRLFIADGHQRLGLAKRIMDQDPKQDVRLVGYRLREVDGITPDNAMVIAALKNIAEGTGTAIDAAKILRIAPERISELPPRSAFVRQANDLSNLKNEAWGMVKNEIVAPNHAAIVGRLIDDGVMQKAALDVLAKTEPANEFQAEAIVRQVRATELISETQESLFGEEVLTQSLFTERAKVLDRAQKQLRKDKTAFQNLIQNADRLEGEGNKLAQDANKRRATDDGKAIALLQSQANKKGNLSDALSAAARQAKETGNYNAATRSFLEDVRRAISGGEFDRAEVGDVGRTFDAPEEIPTIRTDAEEIELDKFDDLFGDGPQEQARSLEAGLRQDLSAPEVQRQELKRAIDQGASEDEIINHPAVVDALQRMEEIPLTNERAGYPKSPDDISAVAWFDNRRYIVDGSDQASFDDAVRYLVKGARELGWVDEGLPYPTNAARAERKAVIVLGPPAAGKSTIANPIARKMGASIVDADEAKKILPEYQGGIGANAVHEESSLMSDIVFKALVEQGDNLVIPKVGGKIPKVGEIDSIERTIALLKSKGYDVELVDMKVGANSAFKRMIMRFVNTGRVINPKYVKSVGDNPGLNFDRIREKGVADGYYRIDNEGGPDDYKDVLVATGDLLDGVELRLRRGGVESGPEVGRGDRPTTVGEGAESVEQLEVPQLDGNFLDEEFPIEILGELDEVTQQPVLRKVTARQLLDEIDQDDAMIDAISRCPL